MNKLIWAGMTLLALATGCKQNGGEIGPGGKGNTPSEVQGKWAYGGSFSSGDFWNYDGSYAGKGFEQGMVFDFKTNGQYEMYVINAVTSYNCRTEAYTYFKGTVRFDEEAHTFSVTPISGNYRGFYSCTPGSNFKRDARADELKQQAKTYYYVLRKNNKGQSVLNVSTTPNESDGIPFDPSNS
ncbi:hypothetical protein [Tellurirhabdus rosea]|uniref:hypothetical protein n=1 Tax=Tellurirhabdus rosea TaxID=2674997 RepID=UPI0022550874|nr:hypothetical protein [Tellurirhabdus rosea]